MKDHEQWMKYCNQLAAQVTELQKKIDHTDKALRMVWSGLELGVKDGPKGNPCDIFLALLEMHGLKRTP